MATDAAGLGLGRQRSLRWLRRRYEELGARLSSTWPAPDGTTPEESSAHQRWVKDNVAVFAEESLLLREIALRAGEVAADARRRSDVVAAVSDILPAIRREGTTLPGSVLEKLAIYGESYAQPGQPIAEVLRASVSPGTTRYWELASIANDLGVLLDATAEVDQWLYALVSVGADLDAPALGRGSTTYQQYVAHGVFAVYGRRTQGQATSLDDHYIGVFGDDWGSGREPAYEIGPSGTDEEHYAELYQYRLWLAARGLRLLEASGQKAIPYGAARADVDRLLTTEFGPWLLDSDDPAIRSAAALRNPQLAATLFNTPNTQWVLTIGLNELQRMGLDRSLVLAKVGKAEISQAATPWLPSNAGSLVLAARSTEPSTALAAQARSAGTAALLAWVRQAQLPPPARPEALDLYSARQSAAALRRLREEERLALQELRQELETAGPRWWPGGRQRRRDLQTRITERLRGVDQLDAEVDQADAAVLRATRRHEATREAWDASHAAVTGRGIAAIHELQRREDRLLDAHLRNPRERLLESIGPPPDNPAGRQVWQEQARQVERARVAGEARQLAPPTSTTGSEPNSAREWPPRGDEGSVAAIDLPE